MRVYARNDERTCSRWLQSLTELVFLGGSLIRKGPILLMVDVWRKQHNDVPEAQAAKLFSNAQTLRHNGHVGTY